MKRSYMIPFVFVLLTLGLLPVTGFGEDTTITFQHSVEGAADEAIKLKDFDFELQQRERDRMKQWNIEDSNEAIRVGDIYHDNGELEDAIEFYGIAIKIDPANTAAHEKYVKARQEEKTRVGSHYHQAMEYYRQGMKDKAIDELIIELKEHPDNEEARIKLNEIESK